MQKCAKLPQPSLNPDQPAPKPHPIPARAPHCCHGSIFVVQLEVGAGAGMAGARGLGLAAPRGAADAGSATVAGLGAAARAGLAGAATAGKGATVGAAALLAPSPARGLPVTGWPDG
jgi:hypothetical protein